MVENQKLQDQILNECRREKVLVELFMMNGFRMNGCIMAFDDDVVVIWSEGKQRMVYKNAISTIVPEKPLKSIRN